MTEAVNKHTDTQGHGQADTRKKRGKKKVKTQFLVRRDPEGKDGLREATAEEWSRILGENRSRRGDDRRFFIEDRIEEEEQTDRMFIEVCRADYNSWHRDRMRSIRGSGRAAGEKCEVDVDHLTGPDTFCTEISSCTDMEKAVEDMMLLEGLKKDLSVWRCWAPCFLDIYLGGCSGDSVKIISRRFGVSEQSARKWKHEFEEHVTEYYKQ